MDISVEQLEEKFMNLPQEVRDAIYSVDVNQAIIEIGKKYNLHVDQMGILMDEINLVMLGVTPRSEFANKLKAGLGLPDDTIGSIINGSNETIFKKIKEELMKAGETTTAEEGIPPSPLKAITKPGERELSETEKTIINSYNRLPEEVRGVIASPDTPRNIQTIGKKNGLRDDQLSDLEDIISLVFVGLVDVDDYAKEIKDKFNVGDMKAENFAKDTNELIFEPIRDSLKEAYEAQLARAVDEVRELIEEETTEEGIMERAGIKIETPVAETMGEDIKEIKGKEEEVLKTAGVVVMQKKLGPPKLSPATVLKEEPGTLNREEILRGVETPSLIRSVNLQPTTDPSTRAKLDTGHGNRQLKKKTIAEEKLRGTFKMTAEPELKKEKESSETEKGFYEKIDKEDPYREKIE